MPLFPPVTDTLRWDDLVRQGRSQLPLVAPGWTDQNTSDPGIALLELLSWLVEADSFRSSAVTERERRLLLALAGFTATAPRPATCLLSVTQSGGAVSPPATIIPAGLVADGARADRTVPLMLAGDIAVSGAAIAVVATAAPGAETDDYRSGCEDLTCARSAGQILAPFGADPAPGAALLIGLQPDTAATPPGLSGTVDLWAVAAPGLPSPEVSTAGPHHSARTTWETWDGVTWTALPAASVDDDTAALTRTGRIRLRLPSALPGGLPAVPVITVGDQSAGVLAGLSHAWLRCRLTAGQHDAAPSLSGVHADAGLALAAQPYSKSLEIPAGTPVTGAPDPGTPLPRAVISLVLSPSGTVTALGFAPAPAAVPVTPASPATALPAIDVVHWLPPTAAAAGQLVADLAVLGVATGIPGESFTLPGPWCGAPPVLWLTEPGGTALPIPLVIDPMVAGPADLAASLDPDGVSVRFGDGRAGRTLVPGTTVLAAGHTSPPSGLTDLHPPLPIRIRADARTTTLLGTATPDFELRLIDGLASGQPGEDLSQLAARAERSLWVHDLITSAVQQAGGTSLDDLPLARVRELPVPERAVTAADFERLALAAPGTSLWRARALPEVDPRLPGLRATGCVTVVVVPALPVSSPEPSAALLTRVRAQLAATRTVGTRVFVVGPDYVRIGVQASLTLLPGADLAATVSAAKAAVRAFLHPVTGGPSGRGWPFGRAVHRSEVMQLLDAVDGVDYVDRLTLAFEPCPAGCGEIPIRGTQLVLAGSVQLSAQPASGIGSRR